MKTKDLQKKNRFLFKKNMSGVGEYKKTNTKRERMNQQNEPIERV